jgi:hypothetical protein
MINFSQNIKIKPQLFNARFLIESLLRGWVAFILLLSLFAYLQSPDASWLFTSATLLLAPALLGFAYHFHTQSPKNQLLWNRVGICFLGISIFITFLWAWKFDSVQISDFGVYFRCGAEISQDIEKWVDDCQSNYLHKNLIYWGRSLLYTTPLASFTGADYPALKLYNATLHTVTMFLWFFGLRQYYGPRIALASTLLLLLYPEWWFTITLATTDNAALLCVVAFILLLPKLNRCGRGGLIILGLSLILFAANLLRAIGPILMLAILFWAIFKQSTKREPHLIVYVFCILVLYAFLNWLLGRATPSTASDPLQFLKVFSLIDFGSTQDFGSN